MTAVFEEFPFLIPFISLLMTMVGFVITFLYFKSTTKSKRIQDNKTDTLTVEGLARDKLKDDAFIAKEVKEEARKVAIDTKDEMMEIIHNIVDKLQNDISRSKLILESEINLMKQNIDQVNTDLTRNVQQQQVINDRMEKSLNFVSQFLWGQGAKSTAYYVTGEDEPQTHKDQPLEGIYMSPDSSETQAMKDHAASTGFASTRTQDIKDEVEREIKKQKEGNEHEIFNNNDDDDEN